MRYRAKLFAILAATGVVPLVLLPVFDLASLRVLWLVPLVLLAAAVEAAVLARPHRELTETAGRLAAGDWKARAFLDPDSAWAPVGAALAGLADQLDRVTRNFEQEVNQRTEALARTADQLKAVGQVGRQVAAVLEPEALLHFVVRVMRGTFGYDLVAVLQRHGDHLLLAACAARGVEEVPLGRAYPLEGAGAPHLTNCFGGEGSVSTDVTPLVAAIAAQAELAVPLRLGGRVLGALVVQSLHRDAFHADELFTVQTIAGQVAVALENARLFEAERQLRNLAIAEERNRMAREIHDTLAQGFMGIIMQLRAMQGARDPAAARFHREQAEQLAQESLQEARRSVWNLRPRPLEGQGLAGALAAEVEGLERRAALSAAFTAEGDTDRLSPATEGALLRIAQEALHNAVKYARAAHVAVRLTVGDGMAELAVADDGQGFDPAAQPGARGLTGGGMGLQSMADRARALGGTLTVETAPGAGCKVIARIPQTAR